MLSPQHKRALLKQLAIDLVALFTYNIKAALVHSKKIIMFTLNIQGIFNALLKKRLLRRIIEQDWPFSLF